VNNKALLRRLRDAYNYTVLTVSMAKFSLLALLLPQPEKSLAHRSRKHDHNKVKGKVVPVHFLTEHHAMKAYWGSGGIARHIL
jgi:hypothetical protein